MWHLWSIANIWFFGNIKWRASINSYFKYFSVSLYLHKLTLSHVWLLEEYKKNDGSSEKLFVTEEYIVMNWECLAKYEPFEWKLYCCKRSSFCWTRYVIIVEVWIWSEVWCRGIIKRAIVSIMIHSWLVLSNTAFLVCNCCYLIRYIAE